MLPMIRNLCILLALCLSPFQTVHAEPCGDGDPSRCRIDIEQHKSRLIRTERAMTRISIADPEIADYHLVTPTQILFIAKDKLGATNLIVWYDEETVETFEIRVFVPVDVIQIIRDTLAEIAPRADIRIRQGQEGLILHGEVDGPEVLDRVLKVVGSFVKAYTNLITVRGAQQVQLSVRVAEVSRTGMKQMGLGFLTNRDWTVGVFPSGGLSNAATAYRGRVGGQLPVTSTTSVMNPATGEITTTTTTEIADQTIDTLARELLTETALASPFATAFQVAVHSLSDDFLSILSVLKGQNLARLLASPTLVTMSGQEASFLVGGEFPVPVQGGDNQVTVQFKSFGIMLRFTPMVVGPETITIQVEPEISNVDYSLSVTAGGVSVPGVKTRRGAATLQLKDGQTFVMAGLLREDLFTTVRKVPFLGDIPYLGALFTSKEFQKNESELMIIVTPRLVRALNPDEVPPLPGADRMAPVSDVDFFLKNRAETARAIDGDPSGAEIIGGTGFAK
jgi:pilus assembly protein CpaC